jgi:hypothetical protein
MEEFTYIELVLLKGEVETIRRNLKGAIKEFESHLKNAEERADDFESHDEFQHAYFLGEATAYREVIGKLKGGDDE